MATSTALTTSREMVPLPLTLTATSSTSLVVPDSNLLITNGDVIEFGTYFIEIVSSKPEVLDKLRKIGISNPEKLLSDLRERMIADINDNVVYEVNIDTDAIEQGMKGGAKYRCIAMVYYIVFLFIACIFGAIYFTDVLRIRPGLIYVYNYCFQYLDAWTNYYTSTTFLGKQAERDTYFALQIAALCSALGITTYKLFPYWCGNVFLSALEMVNAFCSNWPLLIDPINKESVDQEDRKQQVIKILTEAKMSVVLPGGSEMLSQSDIVLALFSGVHGQNVISSPDMRTKFINALQLINAKILSEVNKISGALYSELGDKLTDVLRKLEDKLIRSTYYQHRGSAEADQTMGMKEIQMMLDSNSNASSAVVPSSSALAATNTIATSSNRATSAGPIRSSSSSGRSSSVGREKISTYFAPKGPGGGIGGRRSRRRIQKSKRGNKHSGRSRMRKMRTKKRRMSRRKNRR